jgi:hypothetical protein
MSNQYDGFPGLVTKDRQFASIDWGAITLQARTGFFIMFNSCPGFAGHAL